MPKFRIIGGGKDVGSGNCYLIENQKRGLVFDAGWITPRHNEDFDPAKHLPNFDYLSELSLEGIFISHFHFDHFMALDGLLKFLINTHGFGNLPAVHASPLTLLGLTEMASFGFDEHFVDDGAKISEARRLIKGIAKVALPGQSADAHSGGALEFAEIPHSVDDAMGAFYTVNGTRFFYPGDFKLRGHYAEETSALERVCRENRDKVDVLFVDSTGALKEGSTPSDSVAFENIMSVVRQNKGVCRSYMLSFASHPRTAKLIAQISEEDPERQILLRGRSVNRFQKVTRNFDGWQNFTNYEFVENGSRVEDDAVIFLTGSQNEPYSAAWSITHPDEPDIAHLRPDVLIPRPGDAVIDGSSTIPKWYIEDAKREMLRAFVEELKCELYTNPGNPYDSEGSHERVHIGRFHTSGHAARDDIAQFVDWIQPKVVIPIHGEASRRAAVRDLCPPDTAVLVPEEGEEVVL